MMLKRSFEPTVMFFKLTNSPVIIQTIMNEILQDLIDTREAVSLIDNVIVEIEKKKRHDITPEKAFSQNYILL